LCVAYSNTRHRNVYFLAHINMLPQKASILWRIFFMRRKIPTMGHISLCVIEIIFWARFFKCDAKSIFIYKRFPSSVCEETHLIYSGTKNSASVKHIMSTQGTPILRATTSYFRGTKTFKVSNNFQFYRSNRTIWR
jgi:hypothetical protein